MKSTKSIAVVTAFVLVITGLWFLPEVSGQSDQGQQNSLLIRVAMLEEQVAALIERVEELEERQESTCTCDILNLQPYAELPTEGLEGDICLISQDIEGGYLYVNLYSYINGDWRPLGPGYAGDFPPGPSPGPAPGPSPGPSPGPTKTMKRS